MDAPEQIFKILIVGPPAVGKTCLIRRYVDGVFTSATASTVMVDFSMKVVAHQGRTTNLRLWDIQGQEQPGYMGRTYYGGAVGAMVVCDCARLDSMQEAVSWKKDIQSKVFIPGTKDEPIPCFLAMNKCDLAEVPKKDAMEAFVSDNGFAGYMATSGKKDIGVNAAFEQLISAVSRSIPANVDPEPKPAQPFPKAKAKGEGRCKC